MFPAASGFRPVPGPVPAKGDDDIRRCICFLLCLLLSQAVFPAHALDNNPYLDEAIRKVFKNHQTIGGELIVAKNGQFVYEYDYGYSYVRQKEPVNDRTHFRIASVTKLLSAIRVMQLVEEGKLDLDRDLSEYYGYDIRNPYVPDSRLTLRNLMTHTASLKVSGGFTNTKATLRSLLSTDKKQSANYYNEAFGSVYRYSNFGAGIMGSLIELVTGENVNDDVSAHVFAPLGIDAAYHPSLLEDTDSVAYLYKRNGTLQYSRRVLLSRDWDPSVNPELHYRTTVGSIWITARDLCRIGMLFLQGGELDGVRLLKEETVQEMMSSQKGKGNVVIDSPYGLCVNRVDNLIDGYLIYGHQGLSDDICANLYFEPKSQLVFAFVTNGCNNNLKDAICSISRSLFTEIWAIYGD